MKKALFVTLLCLSTMTFADTIKKDDSLICSKGDGESYIGPASKLFKDGSIQIPSPEIVDKFGFLKPVSLDPAHNSIRIEASKCKVENAVESENISKDVVCDTQGPLSEFGLSKVLGNVQFETERNYLINVTSTVGADGQFYNVKSQLMLINKKGCSLDETVDELNVNNISRAPGKEVPEIGVKFGNSFSKASKQ